MRHILIIGASSAIAEQTARCFAKDGDKLFLVARNPQRLEAVAAHLKFHGATQVETACLDVNELAQHSSLIERATEALGGLDTILIAHGTLPDQKACEASIEVTLDELKTNFISIVSLLTLIAPQFEQQKYGVIAVISSVAGDRGRQSNYVYGTAKAGVSTFLQGLRNRLYRSGVSVITIKPGFVDTPMTATFSKGLLWAKPETVGKGIYQAICKHRTIVYLPRFWWLIMALIKSIPERFFQKLRL